MKKFLPTSTALSVNKSKGFTLVELLVVITIIAILAVVGISAFSGAQKTARDGRRRADIDSIAKAMESRFDPVTGTYPALSGTFFSSNAIPTDPGNNQPYTAPLTNSSKGFYTCVTLENDNGNSSAGGPPTYSVNSANDFYCKSSQQSQ